MYYDYNDIAQGVLISQLYDVFVKLVGELLIVFSIKKNVAHHLTTIIGKMSFFNQCINEKGDIDNSRATDTGGP